MVLTLTFGHDSLQHLRVAYSNRHIYSYRILLTKLYFEKGTNCTMSLSAFVPAWSFSMPPSPSSAAISFMKQIELISHARQMHEMMYAFSLGRDSGA